MPFPLIGGALVAIGKKVLPKVAKAVGGIIAKKVGKKAAKVAVAVGGAVGLEKLSRKVAGSRGGGPVPADFGGVVAGSSSTAARGGRYYRRINPSNPKALRRAVRRVDRAKDMFGKVLAASRATSHSGWKIKPKRPRRKS
jgi:hypothetical protein